MAHILIDGYNLIRQSSSLSRAEGKSLEAGRMALLRKLSLYKVARGHQITVVFDAALTDNVTVEEDRVAGIRVFYSEMGQKADAVIIDLARRLKEKVIVVSSDNEILHAAERAGCGTIGSLEFERKMGAAMMEGVFDKDQSEDNSRPVHKRWTTMKKGPAKRLPKSKRRALRKLEDV